MRETSNPRSNPEKYAKALNREYHSLNRQIDRAERKGDKLLLRELKARLRNVMDKIHRNR